MKRSPSMNPYSFALPVLVSCLAALLGACGTSTRAGTTIDLDPTVISGSAAGDEEIIYGDARDLFEQAHELYEAREYARAARRYELLVEHFPDVSFRRAAFFNLGLCHEGLDDWGAAADAYRAVVEEWPSSDDATDALFRIAECQSQLGDYEGVVPTVERILRRARLTMRDRVEAHTRWGNAAVEMRLYADAEQNYREAVRVNRRAAMQVTADTAAGDLPLDDWHPAIVQAYFGLGRVYHELFLDVRLVLPEEAIRAALVDKGQLLEQARQAYLDAVRAGNVEWSPAAGFMIGQIYEDFYLDILACEVPHDFDELTLEVYFEELREYLDPLITRALSVYEDNLAMAERMGSDSAWVDETRRGIERVQRYLYDEEFQREQERLIREQRHPHGAQDPSRAWRGPRSPDV